MSLLKHSTTAMLITIHFMSVLAWNIIHFPELLAVKYIHLRLSIKVNLCNF